MLLGFLMSRLVIGAPERVGAWLEVAQLLFSWLWGGSVGSWLVMAFMTNYVLLLGVNIAKEPCLWLA